MQSSYSIKENYIAKKDQQIFTMNKPFIKDSINVYLNGALQSFGDNLDYITLPDNGKIIFNRKISEGDIVSIISNKEAENIQIMSFGKRDTANALYKKYTSVKKLKFNNRYTIHLKINDKDIDWQFVTKFTPMFSTIKKIQEDIGEFIQGFTEEYISSVIHKNSWEIINRINEALEDDEASEGMSIEDTITPDPETEEYTSPNRVVSKWVKIKSEIDLIYARYYGISYNYGSVTKTIGDITIEKSTKLPYIDELLKRLNSDLKEAEEAIFGGMNFIGSAVKGSVNYQYSERGTF